MLKDTKTDEVGAGFELPTFRPLDTQLNLPNYSHPSLLIGLFNVLELI